MKIKVYIIYKVSEALYKLFRYETKLKKASLIKQANEIQVALYREHNIRDIINAKHNTDFTTKKAIKVAKLTGFIQ